ncbi:MAG TPA: hypothetical protein VGN98_13595 [Tianweitania sediminis]|nr:hypothetical protein [Tianweitania sediminis]
MRVESVKSNLVTLVNQRQVAAAKAGNSLTSLANSGASAQLGIRQGAMPGTYQPIYEKAVKEIREDVTETRDVTRTEAVFEERAITQERAIFAEEAVYEDRELRATTVAGDRSLDSIRSLTQANIETGADLAVRVGDGGYAVITFESRSSISVRDGSGTTRYEFDSNKGSFADAVVAAFDGIEGLSASLDERGQLQLQTDDAQDLRIADVAPSWFNRTGSPLAALGLEAGTTQAQVVGVEKVQVGTRQVQVGTEMVVVGSEQVQVGTRTMVIGQETVVVGTTTRVEPAGRNLVGLTDNDAPGVGSLSLIDKLRGGGLPAGYVEALFGILEGNPASPPSAEEVRTSYAQNADEPRETKPLKAEPEATGAA